MKDLARPQQGDPKAVGGWSALVEEALRRAAADDWRMISDDGHFQEDPEGREFVYDLVRHKAGYINEPFAITENTVLAKVARDGTAIA